MKLNSILFLSILFASTKLVAFSCPIDEKQFTETFDYRKLIDPSKLKKVNSDDVREKLPNVWLPLAGIHSNANIRISFAQSAEDSDLIMQSFSHINLKDKSLNLLSFGTLKKYPLQFKNLKYIKSRKRTNKCLSPYVLVWQSNNPLTPQTLLEFRVFGPLRANGVMKPTHMEVYFPDGSRLRFVTSNIHQNFGINADEPLLSFKDQDKNRHQSFRNLSGLIEFRAANNCKQLNDPVNNIKNISECFIDSLNAETDIGNLAVIHLNERNQRWMARFSLFPNKSSGKHNQYFSSIVNLRENFKNFKTSRRTQASYILKFGAKPPKYVSIDDDRVIPVGSIAGDGNWNSATQNMSLNISKDLKSIEFEYFEITEKYKNIPGKREIKAFFGTGKYLN